MSLIFVPCLSSKKDLPSYIGFVSPCLRQEGRLYLLPALGQGKTLVAKENEEAGTILDQNDLRVEAKPIKRNLHCLHHSVLCIGGKTFLRNLHQHGIEFEKGRILWKSAFVETVFPWDFALGFIKSHTDEHRLAFQGDEESLSHYLFAHEHLPAFFTSLFENWKKEGILRLKDALEELSARAGRKFGLKDAEGYASYLEDHPHIDYETLEGITLSHLHSCK